MERITIIVTDSMTATILLRGQLAALRDAGFDVSLICSPGLGLEEYARSEAVELRIVPMVREISVWSDLRSLLQLIRTIRSLQPSLVNASTPKAGLLGILAAWLLRVPVRVYTLRGLRLESAEGWLARTLRVTERITSALSHRVVIVSGSLQEAYLKRGLVRREKTVVLGRGSSNGVDAERIWAEAEGERRSGRLRSDLGIPSSSPVVGFVGRLTRDKGIEELARSFREVCRILPTSYLLIVGDYESGDPISDESRKVLEENSRVLVTGFRKEVAPFYGVMDVLAFPSRREGFPNAPLEAGAAGVPVVGFDVTGTIDAIVDGETGQLVPLGDVNGLATGILMYLEDSRLRSKHGEAGRHRATDLFPRERVWQQWIDFYRSHLSRD